MAHFHNNALIGASGQGGVYEIEQSLRFDGSSYLLWTPSSTGDSVRKWTISLWVKQNYATGSVAKYMISAGPNTGSDTSIYPYTYDVGGIGGQYYFIQGDNTRYIRSIPKYRDESAWYHMVFQSDADNATTGDKLKIFVNGERVSTESPQNAPIAQNTYWNSTNQHRIGRIAGLANWTGYLAEFHSVDNQLVDPDQFGEYDESGVWRPIEYTGTYGSNGFYLKFDPSATNGIGHDHSGNGNNWTPTGFNTSGTGTDVMSDTPTKNFATLNPLIGYDPGGFKAPVFSNGNLTVRPVVDANNNSRVASATLARDPAAAGLWQWEMVVNNNNNASYGIMAIDEDYGQGNAGPTWNASGLGGTLSVSGGASASLQEQHATISAGDVITIVVNFDDNEIGWYINGTRTGFYNNCNFSSYDKLVPRFKESTRTQTPCTFDVNFGQKAFQHQISTAKAWGDLSLLPAPTVKDGSDYFDTVLWTGDGTANRAFTNVLDFQPNFSWVKSRSNSENHVLQDSVRGLTGTNGLQLNSNNTNSEGSNGNGDIGAYTSTGFTLSDGTSGTFPRSGVNQSSYTYAGWFWNAGTASGSSNTTGSITSTVSANPTAGFSIVSYTGNNTAGATIGHGLGVALSMIVIKDRDDGLAQWMVYHASLGNTKALYLNGTDSAGTSSLWWNNTSPTSSVFSIGTSSDINVNNHDYIAYCFAEVEGYSKIGSYVGNGNADGPFVYCGFRPAWLLIKRTDSTSDWILQDSKRLGYNVDNNDLIPNQNYAEATDDRLDQLSNGFKLRSTFTTSNASGGTYVFIALAENPFGGSGVSPATAR